MYSSEKDLNDAVDRARDIADELRVVLEGKPFTDVMTGLAFITADAIVVNVLAEDLEANLRSYINLLTGAVNEFAGLRNKETAPAP